MAATKEDIRRWLKAAKKEKATHMVVACDTYDWEDYPVNVLSKDDVHQVISEHSKNMQKVMEVYNMKMDLEEQLTKDRAYNI